MKGLQDKKTRKINEVVLKKYIFVIGMMAIPLLHFAFFYVYINFNSFFISFQVQRYDGSGLFDWSFENYRIAFESFKNVDSTIWIALKNTLMWFCVVYFVNMPLSLICSYFIFKKIKCYKFFRVVMYLPNIIMGTIMVTIYKYMVGTGGPFFALLDLLGKDYIYFFRSSEYANLGMLIYTISTGLGANFILFGGALNNISPEVLEAAKIDGCGPFRELVSIIIPGIWPTLGTMLLLGTTGILGASGPILLFTKGAFETTTLSYWIYEMTIGSSGSQEFAATIGMLMTVVTLPIVFIVKKITKVTED